jgi:hypothetical protein
MRLVRADGNVRMQNALSHRNVHTIVDILIEHRDTLEIVAGLLQTYVDSKDPGIAKALNGIRAVYSNIDEQGNIIVPLHITKLVDALDRLYRENIEDVKSQRGAIVEVFGRKFVCSRYNTGEECANSRRFEDEQRRRITIQELDIAALSMTRRHIEGYECKLKVRGLISEDCVDLAYLIKAAQEEGYHANVGVISFDSDRDVARRLKYFQPVLEHLPSSKNIRVYGLESIELLQYSPF